MTATKSPAPWTVLRGHAGEVQALDFYGQQHLFSGDSDGCVRLWDMRTRRTIQHSNAGRDGRVLVHDITPSGVIDSEPSYGIPSTTYGFCRPHTTITPPSPQPSTPPPSVQDPNAALPVQAQGWLVACPGPAPGHVYLWDTRIPMGSPPVINIPAPDITNKNHDTRTPQPDSSADNDPTSEGGGGALAKTVGQTMSLQFLSGGEPGGASQGEGCQGANVSGAAVPPLLVGYESGSLALWDARQLSHPLGLMGRAHTEPVLCCAASPGGGGMAVTGAADKSVRFWNTRGGYGGKEQGVDGGVLQGGMTHALPAEGVGNVTWRGDGRVVATAGWDGKVRLYSGRSHHKPLAILRHHTKEVTSVMWAQGPHVASVAAAVTAEGEGEQGGENLPGGQLGLLASGSRDTSISLWLLYEWVAEGPAAAE